MKQELIQKARQANLAEYLLNVGVPLVRAGNRYKHAEHNSLTFTENAYYWNSRQEHGNAVDYLTRHMKLNFTEAVRALTQAPPNERGQGATAEATRGVLSLNKDISKVRAYLNHTRHISNSVIDFLVENKLLFQEKQTNNAIFPMYDESANLVGAELRGIIPAKPFHGIKAGSKYGYGYNIRFSANNAFDYALFFESAIDLISFIDWKRNHDKKSLNKCILISMAGLKTNVLTHTLKAYNGNLTPVICVDNDHAGQTFKSKLNIPHLVSVPTEQFKDWNEQLTAWRTSKPINRLIEKGKMF